MRASAAIALGALLGGALCSIGAASTGGRKRRARRAVGGAIVGVVAGAAAGVGAWRALAVDVPRNAVDLDALEPEARAVFERVQALAAAEGIAIAYHSGRRTCAEQDALYAKGRTAPGGIVTNARGCRSWHVLGRAVDFAIVNGPSAARYARVGAIAEQLGAKWGGRFDVGGAPDVGHLEFHPGISIEEACPDAANCNP